MLTRAFVLGFLAVLLPAGALALAAVAGDDDAPGPSPVNTVQGAPATLGPPVLRLTPKPLAQTPPPAADFAMTSASGNRLVGALIKRVRRDLRAKELRTAAGVSTALGTGMARIARRGFEEVYDARVRAAIGDALDRPLVRAGIDPGAVVIG